MNYCEDVFVDRFLSLFAMKKRKVSVAVFLGKTIEARSVTADRGADVNIMQKKFTDSRATNNSWLVVIGEAPEDDNGDCS